MVGNIMEMILELIFKAFLFKKQFKERIIGVILGQELNSEGKMFFGQDF